MKADLIASRYVRLMPKVELSFEIGQINGQR